MKVRGARWRERRGSFACFISHLSAYNMSRWVLLLSTCGHKRPTIVVLLHEHHLVILAFLKLSWDGWTVRSEAAHICTLINRKWSCNRYVHVVLIPKYMIRYHLVSFVNTQLQFVIYCALFKVMHPCRKAADATYQRCRLATEQILQTLSGLMRRLTRTYECMTLQPAAG